jgi:hypothetical protein
MEEFREMILDHSVNHTQDELLIGDVSKYQFK